MSGPGFDEPVDLDSLLFTTRDGVRHIVEPNARELDLARRFARGGRRADYLDHLTERSLAHAFAAVREGSTLEGGRGVCRAELHVVERQWRDPEGERQARLAVRRHWARELFEHGMRPIGWPAVEVRGLVYASPLALHEPDRQHAGCTRAREGDRPDLYCLVVECEAVPE